jgi:hypothetical protein
MPNLPPQDTPVMIAQANQAQAGNAMVRTIGICATAPNQNYSGENGLAPIYSSQSYFEMYENRTVTDPATTTILQHPKHGTLRLITEADRGTLFSSQSGPLNPADTGYAYLPDSNYVGKDSATILVDYGSVKVTVKYYFHAVSGPVGDYWIEKYCAPKGMYLKISSTLDANGNSTVTAVDYLPTLATATTTVTNVATLTSILGKGLASSIAADTSGINLNIADLPCGVVRKTTGTSITLDLSSVGCASAQQIGMNSDLPGSPNIPASPALPVCTALSALLIGRLLRTGYGLFVPVIDSIQIPAPLLRFEKVINPTLTGLASPNGWNTRSIALNSFASMGTFASTVKKIDPLESPNSLTKHDTKNMILHRKLLMDSNYKLVIYLKSSC